MTSESVQGKKDERVARRAVEAATALLETGSVRLTAKRLDLSEKTVRRWLDRDDFQAVYANLSRRAYGRAQGRLRTLSCAAVETLATGLLKGRVGSLQIRAACAILDNAHRTELADISARLEALETAAP